MTKYHKGFKTASDAERFGLLVNTDEVFKATHMIARVSERQQVGWGARCMPMQDLDITAFQEIKYFTEADDHYDLDEVRGLVERRDVPLRENSDLPRGFHKLTWFLENEVVEDRPAGVDYLTTEEEYLHVHNRGALKCEYPRVQVSDGYKNIETGRDLATYVHDDHPLRQWSKAIDLLIAEGVAVDMPGNDPFAKTMHLNGLVGSVLARAWRLSFYLKWLYMIERPEERAYRLGELLPQCYAEGCPLHPSRGGMHPLMGYAGAAAISRRVDTFHVLPNQNTVGYELSLMAENLDFGRLYAGVHVREDGESIRTMAIKLGERIEQELYPR